MSAKHRSRGNVGHCVSPLRSAMVLVAAAAGMAAPAVAQTTNLNGSVGTTHVPALQQSFVNVPVASLSGVRSVDAFGNDATAKCACDMDADGTVTFADVPVIVAGLLEP